MAPAGDDPHPVEIPVTLVSCTTAIPARATPDLRLFLANNDLTVVFMVDSVYFYSTGADSAPESLLQALQECLIHFFPFAGRLEFDRSSQRLQVHTNSLGAPFAVAISSKSIQELGDLSVANPEYRKLVFIPESITSFDDWPLLTAQVTRFSCGGFSLGLSVNHALCDGVGIIQFMTHFTRLARGESPEPPPELHWDRTMLKARSPPAPTLDFGDLYYKSEEVPATHSFSTLEDMLSSTLPGNNFVVSDLRSETFHISDNMIGYLKSLAMADGKLTRCSGFDAVAAYVWKLRTAAVGMPPEQDSVMFMAVDIGAKVGLPRGFLGNQAFIVAVKMRTEDLLLQPLSSCVKLIRETLTGVSDEYVRSWIDWSEIHRGIPRFNGGFCVTSWWKFPFYDMDFGWGKPVYMGPVLTQRVEFVLLLPVPPTRSGGGLDLLLTLSPEQMTKFRTFVDFPRL